MIAQTLEDMLGTIMVSTEGEEVTGINTREGPSTNSPLAEKALWQLEEYIQGWRKQFHLPLRLNGSEFEKKVYRAVMKIPYGETRTYGDIAEALGNPQASRAVGNALGKNPLLIVVPCHRVVASDGLGGFGGGLFLKKALLDHERTYVK